MQEEIHPESTALPTSGFLRLQAHAPDLLTWLGPTWAVLCGLIASGGFDWRTQSWVRLGLLILLVDGGWGSLWAAMGASDWATPVFYWREWRQGRPSAALPYTLPDAPGGKLSGLLGRLRAWGGEVLWPTCGSALLAILVALPTTALLATLLGVELLLLSVAAFAAMQLGVIWKRGRKAVPPGWDALIAVAMPWLAGHVTFALVTLPSAGLAALFALAWGMAWKADSAWGRALTIGGQLLALVSLLALQSPLAAGTLFLLLVPQVSLLAWVGRGYETDWYARRTRPWLMLAMLVAALSL